MYSDIVLALLFFLYLRTLPPPPSTLFPYTTLFRSPRPRPDRPRAPRVRRRLLPLLPDPRGLRAAARRPLRGVVVDRSEEHTSELQSRLHLVCRLLLEKKNQSKIIYSIDSNLLVITT